MFRFILIFIGFISASNVFATLMVVPNTNQYSKVVYVDSPVSQEVDVFIEDVPVETLLSSIYLGYDIRLQNVRNFDVTLDHHENSTSGILERISRQYFVTIVVDPKRHQVIVAPQQDNAGIIAQKDTGYDRNNPEVQYLELLQEKVELENELERYKAQQIEIN